MRYLLDTCFVSELIRPRRDEGVIRWLQERSEESLFLSVVTLGELLKGLHKVADADRQRRIRDWLDEELRPRFRERLIPIDAEISETWGEICGKAAKIGQPLPVMDAWIAATAIARNMIVVTRNVSDLERCQTFNPWTT